MKPLLQLFGLVLENIWMSQTPPRRAKVTTLRKNIEDINKIDQIKSIVHDTDATWNDKFNIISARKNGFVVFEFVKSIPVSERSKYLLDIESNLCEKLDSAITLWIAPVGDKSSLRNLRGIEVKNI